MINEVAMSDISDWLAIIRKIHFVLLTNYLNIETKMEIKYEIFRLLERVTPRLTAIIEGVPAGLAISADDINKELKRRQGGYGRGGRMLIESDQVEITLWVSVMV